MNIVESAEGEIARRLSGLTPPDSLNAISVQEVRNWMLSHLQRYDEELARFPSEIGKSHWNFWMKDFEPGDAAFAAVLCRTSGIELFFGTGDSYEIKRFGESEFPDDPEQVPDEMRKRFKVPDESVRLGREATFAWLSRGGWCG